MLHFLNKRRKKNNSHTIRAIKGENNKIENKGQLLNYNININGNNNTIVIKENSIIYNVFIKIQGDNHFLEIGANCRINSAILWMEHSDCILNIGNFTTIEQAHIAVTEPNQKVIIGKECMFSDNISIRTSDSHGIFDLQTNKRVNHAKSIFIGNHVWVGAKATILKGVTIGNDSIVSLGAIVTKDIPKNCVAAGIPAKVIKENIYWNRELEST